MKENSLWIIVNATNFNDGLVEKRPTSGSSNPLFIANPPCVRTRIRKNGGTWLELVNERKPTLKEIFHVLLPFSFRTIQKNVLYLSIPGLNAKVNAHCISNTLSYGKKPNRSIQTNHKYQLPQYKNKNQV